MKVLCRGKHPNKVYIVTMSNNDHSHIGRAIEIARKFYKDWKGDGYTEARHQHSIMSGLSKRFNSVEDI